MLQCIYKPQNMDINEFNDYILNKVFDKYHYYYYYYYLLLFLIINIIFDRNLKKQYVFLVILTLSHQTMISILQLMYSLSHFCLTTFRPI